MKLIRILPFIFSSMLYAQKANKKGEIKGIDFKAGLSFFDLSGSDAIQIYSAIVLPNLEKKGIQVNGFRNGETRNYCNAFYLGIVSSGKKFNNSRLLKNSENRFGLTYANYSANNGMINCEVMLKNDTTSNLINGIIKYSGYGVHADYTLNSKPFSKNFAAYMSLGSSVILHNYKAVRASFTAFKKTAPEMGEYSFTPFEMVNTRTAVTSIDFMAFFGIKYNLSCDFNLFMEGSIGGSYYQKGLYGNSKWLSISSFTPIGIRYKFVSAEDKSKTNSSTFW